MSDRLDEIFRWLEEDQPQLMGDIAATKTEILSWISEVVEPNESEKQDGRLYNGYQKDYEIIQVPNKSAAIRNRFRNKLRKKFGI
jgi:hypothetical protein